MKSVMLILIPMLTVVCMAAEGSSPSTSTTAPAIPVLAESTISEAEIPLHLDVAKKSNSEDSPWMRMMLGLAIVGIMATGTLFYIRKIKVSKNSNEKAPDIRVLGQHYLGPKKSLAIIRVAGESILIGITDQNISMIKSLSLIDDEIPEVTPTNFSQTLSAKIDQPEDADEFSISGIKDVVSKRLKNMRTFQ